MLAIMPKPRTQSGNNIQATLFVARYAADTEYHRADVLGSGGFKKVGAAASAVANIIADEVGNHSGVTRVIFRDAGLNLADEVGADISCLGIDTAAKLSKKGDKAGAKTEADNQVRGDFRRVIATIGEENNGDPDKAQSRDKESGDSAAAQGDIHRLR